MITADKDLARKVADEMGQLAESNPASRYSFIHFCEENNLFNGNDKHLNSGDLFICCPFHTDESPSLGINLDKHVWHCLSCNRSNVHGGYGSFIDFVVEYRNYTEGANVTYYQQINEFLKTDPVLQNTLGVSSIFRQEKPQDAFKGASYKRFKYKASKPSTYPELATFMKNKKYDKNTIIFAMLQMQTGISPELIYDSITQSKPVLQKDEKALPDYDLDAMLASDEVQKIGDF